MNPHVVGQWVAALRSGDYKQGRIFLMDGRDNEFKFSAVGVLCKVLDLPAAQFRNVPGVTDRYVCGERPHRFYNPAVVPPEEVRLAVQARPGWKIPYYLDIPECVVRLRDEDRTIPRDDDYDMFDLNDYGLTFSQYADYLEWNMEEL